MVLWFCHCDGSVLVLLTGTTSFLPCFLSWFPIPIGSSIGMVIRSIKVPLIVPIDTVFFQVGWPWSLWSTLRSFWFDSFRQSTACIHTPVRFDPLIIIVDPPPGTLSHGLLLLDIQHLLIRWWRRFPKEFHVIVDEFLVVGVLLHQLVGSIKLLLLFCVC